jgi:hypothetical protein
MEFLRTVHSSIYSPEFYKELFSRPFSFSLKYFYSLAAVLAVALAVVFSFKIIPAAQPFLQSIGPQILNYYPDELVITIKNGQASTNVKEPYFLKMPEGLAPKDLQYKYSFQDTELRTDLENLLVIDTAAPFTLEGFHGYKTAVLLMKDNAAYYSDNGEIRIQSLKGIPDATINKPTVAKLVGKIAPFLVFIGPLIAIGTFLIAMIALSFKLVYLLFGALLIWGLMKIKKINGGYKKAYQISIHAMTLSILLNVIIFLFVPDFRVPFFFTIVMLMGAFVNLRPSQPVPTETVLSVGIQ